MRIASLASFCRIILLIITCRGPSPMPSKFLRELRSVCSQTPLNPHWSDFFCRALKPLRAACPAVQTFSYCQMILSKFTRIWSQALSATRACDNSSCCSEDSAADSRVKLIHWCYRSIFGASVPSVTVETIVSDGFTVGSILRSVRWPYYDW